MKINDINLDGIKFDENLDLVLERTVSIPPEQIWKAWTQPEYLKEWFCPKPWRVSKCEMDLRPGGVFATTMLSPEGEEFPGAGCFLELIENRRLVWTSALLPGYRPVPTPQNPSEMTFTAVITMEPLPGGQTHYRSVALHKSIEDRIAHEKMGFHEGWGAAFDQLVELTKRM